jgi:hypothetical protein
MSFAGAPTVLKSSELPIVSNSDTYSKMGASHNVSQADLCYFCKCRLRRRRREELGDTPKPPPEAAPLDLAEKTLYIGKV